MVGFGDPKDHPGVVVGVVLARHLICPPANGMERADRSAGSMVPYKPRPTFSDALALVRQELWAHATFRGSLREPDTVKVPRSLVELA
jgi:hypothetical protein